jgi:hypothetical protein
VVSLMEKRCVVCDTFGTPVVDGDVEAKRMPPRIPWCFKAFDPTLLSGFRQAYRAGTSRRTRPELQARSGSGTA